MTDPAKRYARQSWDVIAALVVLDLTGSTVSVRVVLPALSALWERKIDPIEALNAAELNARDLADPNARLPHAAAAALWTAAAECMRDESFGFAAARTVLHGHFDVLEYVIRNQPTFAEAMAATRRFAQILQDNLRISIEETGVNVHITYAHPGAPPLPRPWSQFRIASVIRLFGEIIGEPLIPVGVGFAHPAPQDLRPYLDVVRVQPTFETPDDFLVLPQDVWDAPVRGADAALAQALGRYAEQLTAERSKETGFVALVQRAVAKALADGDVNAQTVSHALSTSPRTLRRRLAQQGSNFRDLVERVRADLATQYLRRGELSFEDVALLLGYSDATAFHRAFRRWTGVTAAEYRRSGGDRDR